MDELLSGLRLLLGNPLVQTGALPLAAGLLAAALLYPLRLEGLAAAAGFTAAVAAIGGFALEPLTLPRRMVVAGAAAALIGVLSDLAFKPTRFSGPVLGAMFGAAALWVFGAVLGQRSPLDTAILGAAVVALTVWLVSSTVALHFDAARAGAAGLALGLGAACIASLGAPALLGRYGMALGSACGGFLLVQMALGPRVQAGAALTLAVSVIASMLAAGAFLLGRLHWAPLLALALVPVFVRLPLPRAPLWTQALVAGLYAAMPAGGACALAWLAQHGWRL
jgi:hypothetical protein